MISPLSPRKHHPSPSHATSPQPLSRLHNPCSTQWTVLHHSPASRLLPHSMPCSSSSRSSEPPPSHLIIHRQDRALHADHVVHSIDGLARLLVPRSLAAADGVELAVPHTCLIKWSVRMGNENEWCGGERKTENNSSLTRRQIRALRIRLAVPILQQPTTPHRLGMRVLVQNKQSLFIHCLLQS